MSLSERASPCLTDISHSVDFYLFGFDVDFGASPSEKKALDLYEFWQILHKPGPAVDSQNKVDPNRVQGFLLYDNRTDLHNEVGHKATQEPLVEGAALKFVLEEGNFPMSTKSRSDASKTAKPSKGGTITTGTGTAGTGTAVTGTNTDPSTDPTSTGVGTKWFVKGGSFKFRIATDFALSRASVAAGSDNDGDSVTVAVPDPKDTGIYSRPMRVSQGITSELSVTIKLKPGHVVGGWTKAAFDVKAVPQATFGKYDRSTDPSKTDASSLFSAKDGTMPLGMGLMLTAPLPHLAESFVPVFKASDAAKMGVLDLRFAPKFGSDWFVPKFIPAPPDLGPNPKHVDIAPEQNIYIPAELTDAEQNATSQQRWDDVGQQWTDFATNKKDLLSDQVDGLLVNCAKLLAWDQIVPPQVAPPAAKSTSGEVVSGGAAAAAAPSKSMQGKSVARAKETTSVTPAAATMTTTTTPKPWQLVGTFPAKLVRSHDNDKKVVKNLEATYLALPRMGVVA